MVHNVKMRPSLSFHVPSKEACAKPATNRSHTHTGGQRGAKSLLQIGWRRSVLARSISATSGTIGESERAMRDISAEHLQWSEERGIARDRRYAAADERSKTSDSVKLSLFYC